MQQLLPFLVRMDAEKEKSSVKNNFYDATPKNSAKPHFFLNSQIMDSSAKNPPRSTFMNDDKIEILKLAHVDKNTGSHYDIKRMIARLEVRYHWKDLQSDAINYVLKCEVCNLKKTDFPNRSNPILTFSPTHQIINDTVKTQLESPGNLFNFTNFFSDFKEPMKLVGTQFTGNKFGIHYISPNKSIFDPVGDISNVDKLNCQETFKQVKIKPFVCGLCKKTFGRKDHLRNHQLTHTEVRQFRCKIDGCQRTFRRKDRLSDHLMNFHNCPKAIFCHICQNTFKSKSLLSKHMNTEHYIYKCSVCKAGFEEFDEMVNHQQIYCKSDISVNHMALQNVNEKKKILEESLQISKNEEHEHVTGKVRLAKVLELDGGTISGNALDSNISNGEYAAVTPLWWKFVELFANSELKENKDNPNFTYDHYVDWCQKHSD